MPTYVGALIVERRRETRILLGKRSASRAFFPDVWDVPGGHCELGESPDQALVRELREELGIVPTTWRPFDRVVGSIPAVADPAVLDLYEVTGWTGRLQNLRPDEHGELAWFAIEDACRLALACHAYPAVFRRLARTG